MRARKMWKSIAILLCLSGYCCAGPLGFQRNMPIVQREDEPMIVEPAASQEADVEKPAPDMAMPSTLTLPSNATSIRADITDGFSCDNRVYGYYADVENECQIFHVCLPVTYADGKENTFRWSFICPEETVFSQDSFTCMRREDMAIDCEESDKYYELNSNFGMIDDEANQINNNNNMAPASGDDQTVEMSSHMQHQQIVEATQNEEPAVSVPAAAAADTPAKPQSQAATHKPKPMKVQKPNRRKPAPSINSQTKPAPFFPLRKMPTHTAVAPAASEVEVAAAQPVQTAPAEQAEASAVHKYSRRPAISANQIKDKIQPGKQEVTPIRADLYNQKRRRPIYANKDVVASTPAKEAVIEAVKPIVVQPESTLKLETVSVQTIPTTQTAEKSELPEPSTIVENTQTDAEAQASEMAEVMLKPEEVPPIDAVAQQLLENVEALNIKPEIVVAPLSSEPEAAEVPTPAQTPAIESIQAPIEAIEEIPAIIAEVEESAPVEVHEQPAEVAATVENNNDVKKFEIFPYSPAIFEENSEEASVVPNVEELGVVKSAAVLDNTPAPAATDKDQEAVLMAPTPEATEELKHSVGGFKPVDPAMAAEAEAMITDFLNTLMKSESSNAKPIMPTDMAEQTQTSTAENQETASGTQEAEKTQGQEAKDEMESSTSAAEESEVETIDPAIVKVPEEPAQLTNSEEEAEKEDLAMKIQTVEVPAPLTTHKEAEEEAAASVAEEVLIPQVLPSDAAADTEAEASAEPGQLKNASPLPNVLMVNSFPAEMYEIPVKVIHTPIEEMHTIEKTEEQQPNEPLPELAAYKPISIDDIVDLVKERLDQMPEQQGPIALVMKPTNEEVTMAEVAPEISPESEMASEAAPEVALKVASEQTIDAQPAEPMIAQETALENAATEEEQEKPAEQQSEEIIMPIYHRVTEVNASMVKAQTPEIEEPSAVEQKRAENESAPKNETEEQAVQTETVDETAMKTETDAQAASAAAETAELKTKTGRLHRSRSIKNAKMDPRKRRFLFRSDAS